MRAGLARPECRLDGPPERGRIYRGVAVELRLDATEILEGPRPLYESSPEHLADVRDVLRVAPLDLGERLGVEIKMMERHATQAYGTPRDPSVR